MRPIVQPYLVCPTTPPTDDIAATAAGPMRRLAEWRLMCRDFANFDSHLRLSRVLNRTLGFRSDRVRLPDQAPLNIYQLTPVKASD